MNPLKQKQILNLKEKRFKEHQHFMQRNLMKEMHKMEILQKKLDIMKI